MGLMVGCGDAEVRLTRGFGCTLIFAKIFNPEGSELIQELQNGSLSFVGFGA